MDLNPSSLKGLSELTVVVLGAILITRIVFYSIIEFSKLWREAAKERNLIDSKRNEIDEKNVLVLDQITLRLEKLAIFDRDMQQSITDQHNETRGRVAQHDSKVDAIVSELRETRDKQYETLQAQLDLIQTKLDKLTTCTKDLPTVVNEVSVISKLMDELRTLLKQREGDT